MINYTDYDVDWHILFENYTVTLILLKQVFFPKKKLVHDCQCRESCPHFTWKK
jgi:hypothetical protein